MSEARIENFCDCSRRPYSGRFVEIVLNLRVLLHRMVNFLLRVRVTRRVFVLNFRNIYVVLSVTPVQFPL